MDKKLRIGVFATASLPIPPFNGYGGTQRGVYDFLKFMDLKGHELHLFGPGDSDVSSFKNVKLHSLIDKSLWIPENNLSFDEKKKLEKEHYEFSISELEKIDSQSGLDVVNLRTDNLEVMQKIFDIFGKNRIIYSLHNLRNQLRVEKLQELGILSVAHCRNHKREHSDLENIVVVNYGIDVAEFPYVSQPLSSSDLEPSLNILKDLKEKGRDYLINLGGIGKHKGQKTCIDLSLETEYPLILAGEPQDRSGNEKSRYFENYVLPKVDGEKIIYFGNANEVEKKELLKFAKGFLFPSGYEENTWSEPFGRAPVEALSCGVPVVAYRKGSMEEIIFDGYNGFLFDNFEEAKKGISTLDEIDRADCRKVAYKKFNSSRVADQYESLIYSLKNDPAEI